MLYDWVGSGMPPSMPGMDGADASAGMVAAPSEERTKQSYNIYIHTYIHTYYSGHRAWGGMGGAASDGSAPASTGRAFFYNILYYDYGYDYYYHYTIIPYNML